MADPWPHSPQDDPSQTGECPTVGLVSQPASGGRAVYKNTHTQSVHMACLLVLYKQSSSQLDCCYLAGQHCLSPGTAAHVFASFQKKLNAALSRIGVSVPPARFQVTLVCVPLPLSLNLHELWGPWPSQQWCYKQNWCVSTCSKLLSQGLELKSDT